MGTVREIREAESGLVDGLCELLQDSVHGGASVGFLAPLSTETARRYWEQVFDALGESLRLWVVEEAGSVVGSVQLAPCLKENGRHRAELQKLFVHSAHRGRRIGSALLEVAESAAAASGISLLVLDTLRASAAQSIYAHLGWQRAGEIPGYAADPGGALHPTVYFYKQLPP